jgi:hypothetical protein
MEPLEPQKANQAKQTPKDAGAGKDRNASPPIEREHETLDGALGEDAPRDPPRK